MSAVENVGWMGGTGRDLTLLVLFSLDKVYIKVIFGPKTIFSS